MGVEGGVDVQLVVVDVCLAGHSFGQQDIVPVDQLGQVVVLQEHVVRRPRLLALKQLGVVAHLKR